MNRFSLRYLRSNRQFLLRVTCMVLAIVLAPILLGGTVYYLLMINVFDSQIERDYLVSLGAIRNRLELTINQIEVDSLRLAQNSTISNVSARLDHSLAPFHHMESLWLLSKEAQSNPAVQEIMFYNPENGHIISSEFGCIQMGSIRRQSMMETVDFSLPGTRWFQILDNQNRTTVLFIRPIADVYGGPNKGILTYLFSPDILANTYRDFLIFNKSGSFYLLDHNNASILSSEPLGAEPFDKNPGLLELISRNESVGSATLRNADGVQTFIAYEKSGTLTYLLLLPKNDAISRIHEVRMLIAFIAIFLILLGIILVFFVSRSIYRPIQGLLDFTDQYDDEQGGNEISKIRRCLEYYLREMGNARDQLEHLEPLVVRQALRDLLSNNQMSSSLQREALKTYGVDADRFYIVMLVQPSQSDSERGLALQEKPILLFALSNIIAELLQESGCKGYVLPEGDDGYGIICVLHFSLDSETEYIQKETYRFAEVVVASIRLAIAVEVIVGIGGVYSGIVDIGVSLEEAERAIYDNLSPTGNIVVAGTDRSIETGGEFLYPALLAQELTGALFLGDEKELRILFDRFNAELQKSDSLNMIRYCYFQLTSAVCREMEKRGVDNSIIARHGFYRKLGTLRTFAEITDWAYRTFAIASRDFLSVSVMRHSRSAVQTVCEYIQERDMSQISLTQCAEYVSLSPVYLSRIFKSEMGVSFNEYTTMTKVNQTKQLLRETDSSIGAIAQKVGYSERNLSRIFQRITGMTPGQFRTQSDD